MIQRIQSVWLLLAALFMVALFYVDVYHITAAATTEASQADYANISSIKNNYLAIILTGASVLLSLVTIFMFKNRKRQTGMIWINILLNIGLLFWLFIGLNNFWNKYPGATESGSLWIGMFLPFITVFLLLFALRGIRKDQKLLKSLDRLR